MLAVDEHIDEIGGRKGITRIGVLVSCVVAFALLIVCIPVLNSSIEQSRQERCKVNLAKLGVAISDYGERESGLVAAAIGRNMDLATGIVQQSTVPGSQESPFSWVAQILPFLDEQQLYNEIDFSQVTFSRENCRHWAQRLSVLNCPSFSSQQQSMSNDYDAAYGDFMKHDVVPALSQYTAMGATTREKLYSDGSDGAIIWGERIKTIPDGVTKTIMLCETREEKYAAWGDGTTGTVFGVFQVGEEFRNALNVGKEQVFLKANEFGGTQDRTWGPSSMHPDGTYHLFVGGGVRKIIDEIDGLTYRTLITRNGWKENPNLEVSLDYG